MIDSRGCYINGEKVDEYEFYSKKKDGYYEKWNEIGFKVVECMYVAGKLNGLYKSWWDNGKKWEEGAFVAGNRNGLQKSWWNNGNKMMEETYINGVLDGVSQVYNKDGLIQQENTYDIGLLVKTVKYNKGIEEKEYTKPFERYIREGVREWLKQTYHTCGLCKQHSIKRVVVFSCCYFTLCNNPNCYKEFDRCPKCQASKPETVVVDI